MLITNLTNNSNNSYDDYIKFILKCVVSGVDCIQLRAKYASDDFLIKFGRELQSIVSPFDIPLIVNDSLELALALDADGIHLGQSDVSPVRARKLLGDNKIIGLSIESWDELEVANQLNCLNYVAISSVFPTKTKQDIKTIWGLDLLRQCCSLSRHPVIAIGGINLKNIGNVMQAGSAGAAIISAIHEAPDPEVYIKQLLTIINNNYIVEK